MTNTNRILLTGGSGFIGSHFHHHLHMHGVINYDLVAPDFKTNSKVVLGDVRDKKALTHALTTDVDTVIHLAAAHHDFGITREEYFSVNEDGSKVLCEVAAEKRINKIVFYSSVAVYGTSYNPSNEDSKPLPENDYGESKLAGEQVFRKWASEDNKRSVLIIRPVLVFGPNNRANMYNLINQIDSSLYFHLGKANNIKSIAYVENLVQATLYLIEKVEPGVHIYNYADEPHLTSKQIGNIIANRLGKQIKVTLPMTLAIIMGLPFDLAIKLTGKNLPISTKRIKKLATQTYHSAHKIIESGFKPTFSTSEGLTKMVDWYLDENDF